MHRGKPAISKNFCLVSLISSRVSGILTYYCQRFAKAILTFRTVFEAVDFETPLKSPATLKK